MNRRKYIISYIVEECEELMEEYYKRKLKDTVVQVFFGIEFKLNRQFFNVLRELAYEIEPRRTDWMKREIEFYDDDGY